MITLEQLKDAEERTAALKRYLDIDSKKIEVEEEELLISGTTERKPKRRCVKSKSSISG